MYPNPTSGRLTIEGVAIEKISIYEIQGQRLFLLDFIMKTSFQ